MLGSAVLQAKTLLHRAPILETKPVRSPPLFGNNRIATHHHRRAFGYLFLIQFIHAWSCIIVAQVQTKLRRCQPNMPMQFSRNSVVKRECLVSVQIQGHFGDGAP